jgi:hypothetical protein
MSWRDLSVYLGGHIAGLEYKSAVDWREVAIKSFAEDGILGISPMRYKEFLQKIGKARLDGDEMASRDAYEAMLLSDSFVSLRAETDIRRSSLFFANFVYPGVLPEDVSRAVTKGTLIELGIARGIRKPIITVMEPGNANDHPMVREFADYMVSDLETGIRLAKAILLPGRNFISVEGFRPRC